MKTRNNLFKAAAIFAFILFAGNVFATESKAIASSHENITEATLEVENWMTSNVIWKVEGVKMIAEETEADLAVENWMTNDEYWETGYFEVVDQEPDMNLENWMIDSENWKI